MTPERATPEQTRSRLRSFAALPLDPETWRANLSLILGVGVALGAVAVLTTFFSVGGSLLVILIGFPVVALGVEVARLAARVERWRMTLTDPRVPRPHAYRSSDWLPRPPYGAWLRRWTEAEFADENRWRDVLYVIVSPVLATLEFFAGLAMWSLAIALLFAPALRASYRIEVGGPGLDVVLVLAGLVLLPPAAWISRRLVVTHRAIVEALLCVSESEELRERLETVRNSRSAALEVEASELRRIERDLHDGAQQRLLMLAIDLSMAADRIETDPGSAKQLVGDAREQARQALAELRDLVRGVAPAILLDRGLVAAIGAVAGRSPVSTIVDSQLRDGQRLPHAVERTAYFVIAEALANVAKYSHATTCEIVCGREGDRLVVEVRDDGVGGATVAAGGGLAGLRDRVHAVDGSFTVSSSPGGPTVLRAELPTLWPGTS